LLLLVFAVPVEPFTPACGLLAVALLLLALLLLSWQILWFH
jgi:hypothetical protein